MILTRPKRAWERLAEKWEKSYSEATYACDSLRLPADLAKIVQSYLLPDAEVKKRLQGTFVSGPIMIYPSLKSDEFQLEMWMAGCRAQRTVQVDAAWEWLTGGTLRFGTDLSAALDFSAALDDLRQDLSRAPSREPVKEVQFPDRDRPASRHTTTRRPRTIPVSKPRTPEIRVWRNLID